MTTTNRSINIAEEEDDMTPVQAPDSLFEKAKEMTEEQKKALVKAIDFYCCE